MRKNKQIKKEDGGAKLAPYNICDRFCERCAHQKNCRVYKDVNAAQIKQVVEGCNPTDVKNVFHNLEKNFKQIKVMLKNMAKEEGIDIESELASSKNKKRYEEMELNVMKDPINRRMNEFNREADAFLTKIFMFSESKNPFLLPALNDEINDFSFYFPMISAKVYRAISQESFGDILETDDKDDEDANRSACLAINASLVCERAAGRVMSEAPELCVESLKILTTLRSIRRSIKRKFPNAEYFQEHIIFNTEIR